MNWVGAGLGEGGLRDPGIREDEANIFLAWDSPGTFRQVLRQVHLLSRV